MKIFKGLWITRRIVATLVRDLPVNNPDMLKTLRDLGFKRKGQVVIQPNRSSIKGAMKKAKEYLVFEDEYTYKQKLKLQEENLETIEKLKNPLKL